MEHSATFDLPSMCPPSLDAIERSHTKPFVVGSVLTKSVVALATVGSCRQATLLVDGSMEHSATFDLPSMCPPSLDAIERSHTKPFVVGSVLTKSVVALATVSS